MDYPQRRSEMFQQKPYQLQTTEVKVGYSINVTSTRNIALTVLFLKGYNFLILFFQPLYNRFYAFKSIHIGIYLTVSILFMFQLLAHSLIIFDLFCDFYCITLLLYSLFSISKETNFVCNKFITVQKNCIPRC